MHARHRATVEEGQGPRGTAAAVRTGSALHLPAALHEEGAEVALVLLADDLGAPLPEVGVGRPALMQNPATIARHGPCPVGSVTRRCSPWSCAERLPMTVAVVVMVLDAEDIYYLQCQHRTSISKKKKKKKEKRAVRESYGSCGCGSGSVGGSSVLEAEEKEKTK